MPRFMLAALLFTMCFLQCDCLINIESLFQDVPLLGEKTSSRKPLMSDRSVFSPGRKVRLSADQQKDIFNTFSIGLPFEVITGELKPTGKETTSTEFVEQPESGFHISHANDFPPKLPDIFGLKSVLGSLHNRMSSSGVAREHFSGAGVGNTDEVNHATVNDQPNLFDDISIIVDNELNTTPQSKPPPPPSPSQPPILTVDTDVIATKPKFENCHMKKNCNPFNIQGLLSKLFNLSPYQFETTHRPTITQQPPVDESSILSFLNFDNLFLESLRATAAPVVKQSTDVHKKKPIFADCEKSNNNSQRSCGLNLLNIPGLLSKILNVDPLDNTLLKDTAAPKMDVVDSQRFPLQNLPVQFSKAFPTFGFQEYPPTMTNIFPLAHKHRNDNALNGQAGDSIMEKTLNTLSNVSPEDQESNNEQKKEGDKPNTLVSSYFDIIKTALENINLIK